MNIIEVIQKNLGFAPLLKIDPTTQEPEGNDLMGNNALAQAAIPCVLIGIYNRIETGEDINTISDSNKTGNLLEAIFGKSKNEVIRHINKYAKNQDKHNDQQLEHIASESLRVVKESIGENTKQGSVRNFVSKNKHDALLYLPPSIELGKIFNNNNLDDRTGKMEGPISSLMHTVEKTFNTSTSS